MFAGLGEEASKRPLESLRAKTKSGGTLVQGRFALKSRGASSFKSGEAPRHLRHKGRKGMRSMADGLCPLSAVQHERRLWDRWEWRSDPWEQRCWGLVLGVSRLPEPEEDLLGQRVEWS